MPGWPGPRGGIGPPRSERGEACLGLVEGEEGEMEVLVGLPAEGARKDEVGAGIGEDGTRVRFEGAVQGRR